ncbi:MAG TPA: IS630 family transposase [Ktedonobacteraceae bacterium]|nr:IS630 family transposase [Ktedonobacteraceae bacterium]
MQDRLRQAPDALAPGGEAARSRWTLRSIRDSFEFLADYSLPGVWKLLQDYDVRLRRGREQLFSPDPDYQAKRQRLLDVLAQAAAHPNQQVVLFLDQMGYHRWPEPSWQWTAAAPAPLPVAERARSKETNWRLMGALNALNGQVHYLDNYIVGRKQVIQLLKQLDQAYPQAQQVSLVLDNWSIHSHPDVLAALEQMPRLSLVWLPTYAPWLNPLEKLWRKLRQEVLYLHRQAADWATLQARVHGFLDQYAHGSDELLGYVGLQGDGALAQALRTS